MILSLSFIEERDFFCQNSFVYMVTPKDKLKLEPLYMKGDLWYKNDFLGKGTRFFVRTLEPIDTLALRDYVKGSGFKDEGSWLHAILDFNSNRSLLDAFDLSLVTIRTAI